ncbi:hypothetical protein Scep_014417 [Stephania cephalantha]|uniref:Uncharacterized protein n=1 Tax=Stephania cephalantha TaxID=152367 RepID=A0AAP0J165_9MAGN
MLTVYPSGPTDTNFKIVPYLLHRVLHKVILMRSGSKNYFTVLDMYILEAPMRDIKISLPHIIISHITSSSSTDRHLPYAHLLTHFFEEVGINLIKGNAPLSTKETVGSVTLHAMKYSYVHIERRWIRLADIPTSIEYRRHESPHDSDPDLQFNEREYLEYDMLFLQHDEENDGQHTSQDNEEVHRRFQLRSHLLRLYHR